jgi:hypothetical protein
MEYNMSGIGGSLASTYEPYILLTDGTITDDSLLSFGPVDYQVHRRRDRIGERIHHEESTPVGADIEESRDTLARREKGLWRAYFERCSALDSTHHELTVRRDIKQFLAVVTPDRPTTAVH